MLKTNGRRAGRIAALALGAGLLIPAGAQAADTDLSITQTDGPDPVQVGQALTYTVKATNNGPSSATEATLTEKLSSHVDFVSATASQGTCKERGRSVTCDLGGLAVDDGAATVQIRVEPKKAGAATSVATIETGKKDTDPVAANNTASVTTKVVEPGGGGTLMCAGRKVTIAGTAGPDSIEGTAARDVIKAGAGGDVIRGLSNKDVVCAGGGDDTLRGGGDNDLLKGGAGDDLLKGGSGDDALAGGRGNDKCRGGAGTDTKKGC